MEETDEKIKATKDDINKLMREFEERVRDFHSILRISPIAEHFEDIVHQAFVRADFPGVKWDGLDHASGADLFFDREIYLPFEWAEEPLKAPSVKTNIKKQQSPVRIDISGERLGKLMMDADEEKALEDVIDFLVHGINYSYYLLLTRRARRGKSYEEKALQGDGFEEYEMFLIPAKYFHQYLYPIEDWEHTEKKWKKKVEKGFNMSITKSMSFQYWIQGVRYDYIKKYSLGSIEIPHTTILDERYPAEDIAKRKVS